MTTKMVKDDTPWKKPCRHPQHEPPTHIDWRKNVNSKITVLDKPDPKLVERALKIANGLNLRVCGIDFIINDDGAYLLEVNAYPGLYQVPEAEERFIDMAVVWAGMLMKE